LPEAKFFFNPGKATKIHGPFLPSSWLAQRPAVTMANTRRSQTGILHRLKPNGQLLLASHRNAADLALGLAQP